MNYFCTTRGRLLPLLAAGILLGAWATAVRADDRYWIEGSGGGVFGHLSNWREGYDEPPGPEDIAIFDVANMFQVDFESSRTTDRALIRSGIVYFYMVFPDICYTLGNETYASPGLSIGEGNGDMANLIMMRGSLNAHYADVGHDANAYGTLTLDAADAPVELTLTQRLHIGNLGIGFLDAVNGASITNGAAVIAQGGASYAAATISGPATMWTCNGPLTVAKGGIGSLTIDDGAFVTCDDAIIAQQLATTGDVVVAGPLTEWRINGTFDVAQSGTATLLIEDGATVTNQGFAIIGTHAGPTSGIWETSRGKVVVKDEGSTWTVEGDLYVGLAGIGSLAASSGGRAFIQGDLLPIDHRYYDYWPAPLAFRLSSGGNYLIDPAIEVDGIVQNTYPTEPPIQATIEFIDGYVPEAGDSFVLLTAADGVMHLNPVLPELPSPLAWSVSQSDTALSISVISELTADVNNDGVVDILDLLEVIGAWGDCPGCVTDINGDDVVNVLDLLYVIANWTA